jgi:hypothetical protein
MKEAIKTKEKMSWFKELLEKFKANTAVKIRKILSYEKPDGRNQFYREYKDRFAQISLEEQLWVYKYLNDYLKSENIPYEVLTENVKSVLENDETEWAQRVLDLVINEDVFKEDWKEFLYWMDKIISKNQDRYTKEEIKVIYDRVRTLYK